ncbi:type 1 glutamine amidotransferase [Parasediminibacterium paludis]|uniref:Type 1 glutamine amidotransferase n=1 Tax=Parasediminibacterium paludis TaxID=908966 RepID=A0ABV8PY25_9BACT
MYVEKTIKIAILDLYEGHANQGMRCIREIINQWGEANNIDIVFDEFDVRLKLEMPDLSYDAYISSGGPGSPLDTAETVWEQRYFNWVQALEAYNNHPLNELKKQAFFICHSFQLLCRYYKIATVCKRKSTSFGVFPVHMLQDGFNETVFEGLKDPFYAVDSRDYQVITPNYERLEKMGGKILTIEKERPHVPYDRAIMAVRFNAYFMGTQFHPEADAIGMLMHLQSEEKKQVVIAEHGLAKWQSMVEQLQDPDKIRYTYAHILPNFLNQAVGNFVV